MKKNLIIIFSPDINIDCINTLSDVFKKYNIESVTKLANNQFDFYSMVNENPEIEFDYLTFCAHGHKDKGIGDELLDMVSFNWSMFTSEIKSLNLKKKATLILYCCQGGIQENVQTIFKYGPKNLDLIFATKENKSNEQISLAAIDFIHKKEELRSNLEKEKIKFHEDFFCYLKEDFNTEISKDEIIKFRNI